MRGEGERGEGGEGGERGGWCKGERGGWGDGERWRRKSLKTYLAVIMALCGVPRLESVSESR